jgi:3D (Asp-Asp-Asp) domain-containing protein
VGRGRRRRSAAVAAILGGVVALAAGLPGGVAGSARAAPREASRYRLSVDAVAYHLAGRTALGVPCAKGVVAVDPRLIPLGTKMFVPGYGMAVAADVGTAVKGRIIDLWMPTDAAARKWGRRTVTVTILR